MIDLLPTSLSLLLQSNEQVAQAVQTGQGLPVDFSAYGGFTGYFAVLFLVLIQFWNGVLQSYGFAIILTAISVRILLLPLTVMQIKGMKMMQALQPVQKEIMRFYPNKADQNAKMMELYSAYKINPLSGCLPMLIQFPILIGVYRALYDPSFAGHSFLNIQLLFPVSLTSARTMTQGPDIADIIDVTVAQLGLHSQIWRVPEAVPLIGGAFWYLPALGLVVLYAGSSFLMQRVMRAVNKPDPEFEKEFKVEEPVRKPGEPPPPPDFAAQMQRQMGLMNVMILVIAFIFSAGALLYFVVQNLLMSLEYTLLGRKGGLAGGQDFDAKEMKAFIRKPPPPLPQHARATGAGQASPQTDKRESQEDSGTEPSKGELTPRPRKKRRKR